LISRAMFYRFSIESAAVPLLPFSYSLPCTRIWTLPGPSTVSVCIFFSRRCSFSLSFLGVLLAFFLNFGLVLRRVDDGRPRSSYPFGSQNSLAPLLKGFRSTSFVSIFAYSLLRDFMAIRRLHGLAAFSKNSVFVPPPLFFFLKLLHPVSQNGGIKFRRPDNAGFFFFPRRTFKI